ncbi:MAG: hypothetical protein VX494_16960 [Actinomycetota bacterium]|nr:hypothetical protein [Actinomycetota bacterium]
MSGRRGGDRLRLRVRGLATLAALAATTVVVVLLGADPHPDRLAVLGLLGLLVAVLVWELLPEGGSAWRRPLVPPHLAPGQDRGTASWVRVLEDHRAAARPGPELRDRVRRTVADVLLTRHGLRLDDLDEEERRARLGAPLDDLLHGPVRRLAPQDLLSHLERIESL